MYKVEVKSVKAMRGDKQVFHNSELTSGIGFGICLP